MRRTGESAIPDVRSLYHTYISHHGYDEGYLLKGSLSRVSEKACWLFEADLGEGLRGYVPRSSYVSMARCVSAQIPQNSRPDCGGWARLPVSGPWRRGHASLLPP
jgi:hypothetical protein